MTRNLTDFLTDIDAKKHATQNGTSMHLLLKHIVINKGIEIGDKNIINQIKNNQNLCAFFATNAKTEVPIAGIVNGAFISRRIDRLLIDDSTKTIYFIDYKTDIDKSLFIDKYKKQLGEYSQLLKSAYPEYKIIGYILWIQNWDLEQII